VNSGTASSLPILSAVAVEHHPNDDRRRRKHILAGTNGSGAARASAQAWRLALFVL
jgi:hypothetical protein